MNTELLTVALLAGAANWAFRALPVLLRTDRMAAGGWLEQFLSATGPAAIATLFTASVLPALVPDLVRLMPLITGTLVVLGCYFATRSVVVTTLFGAIAYGATVWMIG